MMTTNQRLSRACITCKEVKSIETFRRYTAYRDSGYFQLRNCDLCRSLKVRCRRVGITPQQYFDLYKKQKGRCAVCRQQEDTLCIDHDHDIGTIRGLLCQPCNRRLGVWEAWYDRFTAYLSN